METVEIKESTDNTKVPPSSDVGLEDAFDEFEKYTTDLKAVNVETSKESKTDIAAPDLAYQVKVHFFVGIFLFLVSGVHTIVMNIFTKYNISVDELAFAEHEKTALVPYFNSPKIVEWLNKIPDWVLLVAQMEFFMINKISNIVKTRKEQIKNFNNEDHEG